MIYRVDCASYEIPWPSGPNRYDMPDSTYMITIYIYTSWDWPALLFYCNWQLTTLSITPERGCLKIYPKSRDLLRRYFWNTLWLTRQDLSNKQMLNKMGGNLPPAGEDVIPVPSISMECEMWMSCRTDIKENVLSIVTSHMLGWVSLSNCQTH